MSYRWLDTLYLANASLLVTHEIDSAYWNEWELLHLPGGIQFFLVLNLVIVALALFGYRLVALRRRSGLWSSIGLACAGLLAFVIHATFLARGHPEFRLPVSLAVLGSSLFLSLVQGGLAWRHLQRYEAASS